MAKIAAQQSKPLSPIVAAMLNKTSTKAPIGERILASAADAVGKTALVTGRLVASVDTDRFADGMKTQRFLNITNRSDCVLQLK